ncbi:MAG: hypothetical protein SOW50_04135 [Lachnospiraceae bacterium]|nr:hypothetical protein [Lachnospiraceae bacterium]
MPRLAVSENEKKDRILRGSIKNAQELQGLNAEKISRLTGIPKSTVYAKIRDPERLTIRELRLICGVLKYPDEEKERIGREAI